MRTALLAAALVAAAAAVTALSCSGEGGAGPAAPGSPHVSPAEVLANVRRAFNGRDLGLLEGALAADFVFYARPEDVGKTPPGGNYEIPASWTRDEFLDIAAHMFARAHSIDFWLSNAGIGTPPAGQNRYRTTIPIDVTVMVTSDTGYRAEGYCNVEFTRDEGAEGEVWWLAKWWDYTEELDGPSGVTPASLGRVLAIYY